MLNFRRLVFLLVGTLLVLPSNLLAQCGVERWSVKTGTDADAGMVNLNAPMNTTIANMRAFPTPNPIPANNRVSPAETTLWVINATLTVFKLESDSDYHLVIQDASGNTMITEIPAPSCVGSGSPFLSGITNARSEFDARFTATTSFQTANIPVQITGVGMFDFPHGQTGAAPNQIELHPVLNVIFNPSTTPDFSMAASPAALSVTQGNSGATTISTGINGGFNSTISLSVSGLPAGVTASFGTNPVTSTSTVTFTASSTATTGPATVTITGTSGTLSHTTSIGLTVNASGGGGAQQLIVNGGFETGTATPWSLTAGVLNNSTAEPAHTGSWDAWLDGYGTNHTDTASQTVTIPSTATSATLTFWLHIDTAETTTTTAFDTLKVQVFNTSGTLLGTLGTFSNLNKAAGYTQRSFNVLSFAGQTVKIHFVGTEDSSLQTSFVIDDVALNVQ